MILLNEICVHGPPLIECHSAIWFCCDEFKCKILIFFFLVIPSTFLAEKYNFTVMIYKYLGGRGGGVESMVV